MSDKETKEKSEGKDSVDNLELMFRSNGEPFVSERSAQLRAGQLAKAGRQVVPVELEEGGWALKRLKKGEGQYQGNRIPIGRRNVMTAPKRKGYVRRWVNDQPGRINMFEQAGWQKVTNRTLNADNPDNPEGIGDPRAGVPEQMGDGVTIEAGQGMKAVLMEIPKEWYDEAQEEKVKAIKVQEEHLISRTNKEGHYGNISIDGKAVNTDHRGR